MRWGFVILLWIFFTPGVMAYISYVDGPGDGDGDGSDDYDTIEDALMELGLLGFAHPVNEVHIMVDRLTEQPGLLFNGTLEMIDGHWPLWEDEIIVEGDGDGNGVGCVVDFYSPATLIQDRYAFIQILLDSGQSVTLRDLTVMPTYRGYDIAQDFMIVWKGEGVEGYLTNADLTLERFTLTASNASNEPQDPDVDSGSLTSITDGFNDYVVLRMVPNPYNAMPTLNLHDCVFAHQQAGTVYFRVQAGHLNATNTRITRCGFYASGVTYGSGIAFVANGGADISLDHVVMDHNWGNGLTVDNAINSGGHVVATVGPGCRFNENSKRGVFIEDRPGFNGAIRVEIAGTAEEPVEMSGNGSRGCVINTPSGSSFTIDHAVITDNPLWGMYLIPEPALPGETNLISNTLIANNGALPIENGEINPAINCEIDTVGTASSSALVEFRNCTFHDVRFSGDGVADNTQISMGAYSSQGCEVVLTNCIISGSSEEVAFGLNGGEESVVTLNNSCVVLDGLDAVGALRTNAAGTLNFNSSIFIDPQYMNTVTPPDADSFDVNSAFLGHAGPGGDPLSGWGDYVGTPYEEGGAGVELH